MQLQVHDDDLPLVLACLGIGILSAIRRDLQPPTMGIQTLGRPRFWEPLLDNPAIPPAIIDVFQTCDELDALQQLAPEQYTAVIDTLILRLENVVAESKNSAWNVHWIEHE